MNIAGQLLIEMIEPSSLYIIIIVRIRGPHGCSSVQPEPFIQSMIEPSLLYIFIIDNLCIQGFYSTSVYCTT